MGKCKYCGNPAGFLRSKHSERIPLYLLTVFGKNEKSNITKHERNELAKLVDVLVQVALEKEHD